MHWFDSTFQTVRDWRQHTRPLAARVKKRHHQPAYNCPDRPPCRNPQDREDALSGRRTPRHAPTASTYTELHCPGSASRPNALAGLASAKEIWARHMPIRCRESRHRPSLACARHSSCAPLVVFVRFSAEPCVTVL